MPSASDMTEAEYQEFLQTASIGGSQVGTVMGLNRYDGPEKVYDQILGLPSGVVPDNPHMRRGRAMEPVCADAYARETGRLLSPYPRSVRRGVFRATPDRGIAGDWGHEGPGILEIKCPTHRGFERVKRDGVDPSYYAQLQLYMSLTERQWGSFAFWSADQWELYWFDVPRDEEFITAMMASIDQFWTNHIIPRVRPTGAATPVWPPPHVGREHAPLTGAEDRALMRALRDTTRALNAAEAAREGVVERVKARMTALGHDRIEVPGVGKVSWVGGATRRFNRARLEAAHPELDLTPFFETSPTQSFRPEFPE